MKNLESKRFKYLLVYNSLRDQIISGQREYGSTLPSARQLSEIYQVGIWTIKTALKLLSDEGLIHTEERKKAVVIYKMPLDKKNNSAIHVILKNKLSILDVYETMELLMPDIFAFCSLFSYTYELDSYETALKWAKRPKKLFGRWKASSALLHDFLRASGNLLFSSIYSALELNAEITFLMEYQQLFTEYTPYTDIPNIKWLLDILQSTDSIMLRKNFAAFYHSVTLSIKKSFEKLSSQFPNIADESLKYFSWNAQGGQCPYYMQIAGDIVEKTGLGIYQYNTYLPSEASLARQYNVSVHTIRKALAYLNTIGHARTLNGKGTLALKPKKFIYNGKKSAYNLLLYLSALQTMTVIIRPTALFVFDRLDAEVQQQLKLSFSKSNPVPLAELIDCIINNAALYPLEVILRELDNLINLGCYYSFFDAEALNAISLRAFYCLQSGDRKGFADGLFECYRHILRAFKGSLTEQGFTDALKFREPE